MTNEEIKTIIDRLRQRHYRRAGESNDEAQTRRQSERDAAADLIEGLGAEIERLNENASWMNIVQGNLQSLLKDRERDSARYLAELETLRFQRTLVKS